MFDLLQIGERTDLEDARLFPREFPLYFDGSERMRFRYAIFLLNKAPDHGPLHYFTFGFDPACQLSSSAQLLYGKSFCSLHAKTIKREREPVSLAGAQRKLNHS
jgi:hypothetical protein